MRAARSSKGRIDAALPALRKIRERDTVEDGGAYLDDRDCQDHSKQQRHSRLDGFPTRLRSRKGMSRHDFAGDFNKG
jgi:hypothetical protein